MESQHTIEVIDPDGWRKTYTVNKAIVHVGSDVHNDVTLDPQRGSGVAPRHLQLITVGSQNGQYRLVNLSGGTLTLEVDETERVLEPRSSLDVQPGARVFVGNFALVLGGGRFVDVTRDSEHTGEAIGLKLNLPRTTLTPDRPIEGFVTVSNRGDETAVQFELKVQGLPEACYELGPAPILFPGASKEIFFRLRHPHGPALPAGDHEVSVHATAPESYPGDSATVAQTVHVRPYYSHTIHLTAVER